MIEDLNKDLGRGVEDNQVIIWSNAKAAQVSGSGLENKDEQLPQ
jgi:hypothetical protein